MQKATLITIVVLNLLLLPFENQCNAEPSQPVFPRRSAIVKAVEKAGPSVVNISTERIVIQKVDPFYGMRDRFFNPRFKDFFDRFSRRRKVRTHSLGSGVIIDRDGLIVTNEHVIRKASQIHVTLADKSEFTATLVSADPENDVAVLRIPPSPNLVAASIGTSSDLMMGETAIALGNPFGLESSVSVGVISAKNRSIIAEGEVVYKDFLQTDAAINPGNSGGPLLNIYGDVIGINTAVYAEGQGISFAIPIDKIVSILEGLLDYRVLKEIWIGFQLQTLSPHLSKQLSYTGKGLVITDVESESPAQIKGFKVHDIITQINERPVTSVLDFNRTILRKSKGEKITIHYYREGKNLKTVLTLAAVLQPSTKELIAQKLGLKVQTIVPELAKRLRLRSLKGLLITEIIPDGPAAGAGLRQLDVMVQIGRFRINNEDELGRLLQHIGPGTSIPIMILRGTMIGRTILNSR